MQLTDVDDVLAIDRLAFPTPAKRALYVHELTRNELAHYQCLLAQATLIGYSGYWLMGDEVHVSTIAVHPAWRRRGLGELLLLNMLDRAYTQPATLVTLEVRRSNTTAQALYRKYKFDPVGERPRYYRDTGEDALLMTMPALDADYRCFLDRQRSALWARLAGEG